MREGWGDLEQGTDRRVGCPKNRLVGHKLTPKHRLGNHFIPRRGVGVVGWEHEITG